ncbi:MAG: SGNH/GDSL hydrolase family protein, partial [Bdellovibrionales bacterium]|nr:SGNH/GDSL hydrolase family protein [Bdellovibrionales bacterium]
MVIATISLCEVTARILHVPVFTKGFRVFDKTLGWKLSSNGPRYTYNDLRTVLINVNPDGFRDDSYPHARAPRIKRVAVIGDSFTEAFQVNRDQTFLHLLERQLNEKDKNVRWEVMNFGVGDFGTAQELLVLENEVWKYGPDAIILQTFPLNDVANNSLSGFGMSSPQDEFRPYLNPRDQYQTFTFAHPLRAFLRQKSEFFLLMEN